MASFGNLYDYNTSKGIVIPQTSTVKESVEQAFKDIFGSDFSTAPETTNGRLIEALTLLFTDVCGVNAQNANGLNIESAVGAFLDGLGATWGVERQIDETDAEYRSRIISSSSRGSGFALSIANEIARTVDNFQNVVVLDNGHEDPDVLPKDQFGNPTPHSIAVPGHTVYICVGAGTWSTIAIAIMRTLSAGCSMDDNNSLGTVKEQTVTVDGTAFTAKFHRPSQVYVWITATVNAQSYTGSGISEEVESSIRGLLSKNRICATVTKPQIMAAVSSSGSGIVATDISIRTSDTDSDSSAISSETLNLMPYNFIDPEAVTIETVVQ